MCVVLAVLRAGVVWCYSGGGRAPTFWRGVMSCNCTCLLHAHRRGVRVNVIRCRHRSIVDVVNIGRSNVAVSVTLIIRLLCALLCCHTIGLITTFRSFLQILLQQQLVQQRCSTHTTLLFFACIHAIVLRSLSS